MQDFEPPYFSPKVLPFPDLKLRAALVSAQVINYSTLAVETKKVGQLWQEAWLAAMRPNCGFCIVSFKVN